MEIERIDNKIGKRGCYLGVTLGDYIGPKKTSKIHHYRSNNRLKKNRFIIQISELNCIESINYRPKPSFTSNCLRSATTSMGSAQHRRRNHHLSKDTRRSNNDDVAMLYLQWRSLQEEGPLHVIIVSEGQIDALP